MSKKKKKFIPRIPFKERVKMAYEMFDDDDISTERLLAMVADYCHCDVDAVIEVLAPDDDTEDAFYEDCYAE